MNGLLETRKSTWEEYRPINEFDIDLSRAAIDMYRLYGLLPVGDTVRGGSWKYHYDLKTKQYLVRRVWRPGQRDRVGPLFTACQGKNAADL